MSAIERRLARIEERRLAAALVAFRQTLDGFEAAQQAYFARRDPGRAAREEAEAAAEDAAMTPERRDHLERLHEAVPILRTPWITPTEQAHAIALLEPVVRPRGSPTYAIIGAIRRYFAEVTAQMQAATSADASAGSREG